MSPKFLTALFAPDWPRPRHPWIVFISAIALFSALILLPLANGATISIVPGPSVLDTQKPDANALFVTDGASSYFIDRSGRLWAWGSNNEGELGNGSTVDSSTPVLVQFPAELGHATIQRVVVDDNGSVYALDSAGRIWAWGNNSRGQLGVGRGDLRNRSSPVHVQFPASFGRASIDQIVSNDDETVLAIDSLGRLWTWGDNSHGQLGVTRKDIKTSSSTPVQVSFPSDLGNAMIVHVMGDDEGAMYALDSQGHLWSWGADTYGELGIGSKINTPITADTSVPSRVRFPSDLGHALIVGVTLTNDRTVYAIDSDGHLWAWGNNLFGKLGNGTSIDSSIPVRVRFPDDLGHASIDSVAMVGNRTEYAIDSEGHLWAWGNQLPPRPIRIRFHTPWWRRSVSIVRTVATSGSPGGAAVYAIDNTGHLWAWAGGTLYGRMSTTWTNPVRVRFPPKVGGASIVSVAADYYAAYAIDSAGRLWSWGNNRYGQLGNGSIANRYTPPGLVHFPSGVANRPIIDVSAVRHDFFSASAYAVDSTGQLWAWGYNKHGQLGDGSSAIAKAPVPIRLRATALQHAGSSPRVAHAGMAVCAFPKRSFVYVADQEGLSGYRVDPVTGALAEIPGSPFPDPGTANFITANPSGTIVYVTNLSNTVSAYRVDAATGALTEIPGSPFKAGNQPYRIRINRSGTIAYVANWMSGGFRTYQIDAATGAIAPTNGGSWPFRNTPFPEATLNPAAPFAYVVSAAGIEVFRVDPKNDDYHEVKSADVPIAASHITLNPAGTLAYVTINWPQDDENVSAFHVDSTTGALTPVTGNPVAKGFLRPDQVAIDCSGTFAYVTAKGNGLSRNKVWAYRINSATGALTPVAGSPFATGTFPLFVAVVQQ